MLAGQSQQLLVKQRQWRVALHSAIARSQLAGQHTQQGGFATAVVTDHGDALAATDLQLQRGTAAMRQHQGLGLQQARAATFPRTGKQRQFRRGVNRGCRCTQLLRTGLQAF